MTAQKPRLPRSEAGTVPLTKRGKNGIFGGQMLEASGRFRPDPSRGCGSPMRDAEWLALVNQLRALDPDDFEAAVAAVRMARLLDEKK